MKYKNHIPNNFSLASRTALITGGAGFLGKHFAESLLANDCSVIISDVSLKHFLRLNLNFKNYILTGVYIQSYLM